MEKRLFQCTLWFKFFFAFLYPALSTFLAGSEVLFDEMDADGIWAKCLSREVLGTFEKKNKKSIFKCTTDSKIYIDYEVGIVYNIGK